MQPAPTISYEDMTYSYEDSANRRKVRVYNDVNARLTLEDFFAKMKINFG